MAASTTSMTSRCRRATASTRRPQSIAVTVTDVDEFDVGLINDTNVALDTVAENAAVGTTVGITAFASDADGSNNTITYSLDATAGGRFAISAGGVVTVAGALDFEAAQSHTITVRATSTDGSFSTRDFAIPVTGVSDTAPVAQDDVAGIAEDVDTNPARGRAERRQRQPARQRHGRRRGGRPRTST